MVANQQRTGYLSVSRATVYNFAVRNVWALIATTMVLMAINAAPAAGESSIPIGARMPAANGRATML